MLLRWVALSACVCVSSAVTCYDCYNTGPDYKDCTRERSCKGTACMICQHQTLGDDYMLLKRSKSNH
uniref:Secreted protein n=1 Tax=Heterorhabditis bacteriophora TaxID=37862 RepID=A0A1I7XMQ4_HETBA